MPLRPFKPLYYIKYKGKRKYSTNLEKIIELQEIINNGLFDQEKASIYTSEDIQIY